MLQCFYSDWRSVTGVTDKLERVIFLLIFTQAEMFSRVGRQRGGQKWCRRCMGSELKLQFPSAGIRGTSPERLWEHTTSSVKRRVWPLVLAPSSSTLWWSWELPGKMNHCDSSRKVSDLPSHQRIYFFRHFKYQISASNKKVLSQL